MNLTHVGIQVTATGGVVRTGATSDVGIFTIGQLKAGSYSIKATANRYLPNCTTTNVTIGQSVTLANTTLKGGDANGDENIDIGDATLVAANFSLPVPPADVRADINGDNVVNIQDLAILGGNYGLSGCQNW